jgi:hypothetical protein
MENIINPLYQVGQFRGLSGSPSSQSTSNEGSRVIVLSLVLKVEICGRDVRDICAVIAWDKALSFLSAPSVYSEMEWDREELDEGDSGC